MMESIDKVDLIKKHSWNYTVLVITLGRMSILKKKRMPISTNSKWRK